LSRRGTDRFAHHPGVTAWAGLIMATAIAVVGYETLTGVWAEVWFQFVAWASIAAFAVGLCRHRTVTIAWVAVGGGFVLFAIGDLLFSLNEYVFHTDGFPSSADVSYLLGYPAIAIGLATLVKRARTSGRSALIDAGIVVTPLAVAGWVYIIEPLASQADLSPIERIVSSAYPIGDLLCIAVLVRLMAGFDGRSSCGQPALGLLVAGLASLLLGDVLFLSTTLTGTYISGGWTDGMFLMSYVALGATGLCASISDIGRPLPVPDVSLSKRRLVLLAVAALVIPAMLAVQWLRGSRLTVPLIVGGTIMSFLLVVARMSGLVQALETSRSKLRFEATHDPLTELPNRQLCSDHLASLLSGGTGGAMLFVDLDHFKSVNDTLGHHVGDDVLIEVAGVLRATVRDRDFVARLAGDEFVVLIESEDQTELLMIAQRLVDGLRVERGEGHNRLLVTASVGLVQWGRNTPADQAHQLMRAADAAMYDAKRSNGDQMVIASL
jgi:diguanylate cyclase (GGDEF)-like protein